MSDEASRVLSYLASMPSGYSSVTREQLREIMLQTHGTMLACGRLYEIRRRHLGAGVYRISLELAP